MKTGPECGITSRHERNTFETFINLEQWRTQEFCSGGVQQIQLRTEDGENGDLGALAT